MKYKLIISKSYTETVFVFDDWDELGAFLITAEKTIQKEDKYPESFNVKIIREEE